MQIDDEKRMLDRYLLGEALSEEELEQIEQRYFEDGEFFRRLQQREEELIERYVQGSLSERQRALFEANTLSSERVRQACEEQRRIQEFFRGPAARAQSGVSRRLWWGSVAALAAAGGGFLVGAAYWRQQAHRAEDQLRLTASARAPETPRFALKPGVFRSGDPTVLRVSKTAGWAYLELQLNAPADAAEYALELRTADGEVVWAQSRLAPGPAGIVAQIPASVLRPDDYVLALAAIRKDGRRNLPSYVFRVER